MAPLAAQSAAAPPTARAIAEPDLLCAASFFAPSMMLTTPCGATDPTKCSSESKTPVPSSPSRPISKMTVGRNASKAPNATCWERPVQSSLTNRFAACLKTAGHSDQVVRVGSRGSRLRAVSVVAVDKGKRAKLRLRRPFPAPARKQPHRRADPAGGEETCPERAGRHERKLRAKSPDDVRCLGETAAEVLHRAGQLLALQLDVAADLLWRSPVRSGHRASTPPSSIVPPRLPAPEPAASPFGSSSGRGTRAERSARRGGRW